MILLFFTYFIYSINEENSNIEKPKNKFLASQIGGDDLSIHTIQFLEKEGSNVTIPTTLSKAGKSFNVVELKDSAFQGSPAGAYHIPYSITKIGRKCFSESKYLKYVDFSQTPIERVRERTFADCPKLERVDFPQSLTILEDSCFFECVSLKYVDLKKTNLYKIEKNVFSGCINLESILLPSKLQYIGSKAFSKTGIKELVLPSNFEHIAASAFEDSLIEMIDLSKTLVSVIENCTFWCCSNLAYFIPPKDLVQIRAFAFYKTGFQAIDFTKTKLEEIHESAFCYCSSLLKIKLPETFTFIGENAFVKCNFKTFTVQHSIKQVGSYFLSENDKLEELDLSNSSLSMIPDFSFSGCSLLSSISFPSHDIGFGVRCFADTSISYLYLSKYITFLGKECFFRCSNLVTVSMNDSLIEKLPEGCFRDCSMLSDVIFSDKVLLYISNHCFEHCAFRQLIFQKTIIELGENSFWNSPNLEIVSLLNTNITEIPRYCFADCDSLKYVYLPETITKIGNSAFEKCPLSIICYYGLKSPSGSSIKVKVVSVTKAYLSETFCGIKVTKNLTKFSLLPGYNSGYTMMILYIFGVILCISFIIYKIAKSIIAKKTIAVGDFESLLSGANDED